MLRVRSVLLLGLGLAVWACGKSEHRGTGAVGSGGEASAGGSSTMAGAALGESGNAGAFADAGAGGEACAETERTASEEAINARTASMVDNALPHTPVPLFIELVELSNVNLSTKAELEALNAPYLDELEARLMALGATELGRFDSGAAMSASLEAQYVKQVLCWSNVVMVDVLAVYYDIAVPPWSDEEAGARECPLVDGACPEHCEDYHAIPFDEVAGCFSGIELVVCQRSDREFNEDLSGCYENEATGVPILFPTLTPAAPGYLGWIECSDPIAAMGLTCDGEEQP